MATDNPANTVSFEQFLEYFPSIELPVTLGERTHHLFSRQNDPLPPQVIEQYLLPIEEDTPDELTEFVPGFRVRGKQGFVGLVYWKAGLLNYQYRLVTFHLKSEQFIAQRVLAGLYYDGLELTQSVATITPELQIYVVSGQQQSGIENYQAGGSTAQRFQISSTGKIVEL